MVHPHVAVRLSRQHAAASLGVARQLAANTRLALIDIHRASTFCTILRFEIYHITHGYQDPSR
eukprot:scaffold85633_cov105-Phaeocystis_antarctica.AAC.1